jgi:two-component system CAI-1 autoinducer sensor kinase/phosphatase CqsS
MTNLGMFWGLGCGWVLWALDRSQPHFSSSYLEAFAVVFFAWVSALLISVSVTSRIEEQLNDTLATMAILAHELRTPLAAVSLSTEALRINAKISKDPATSAFMVKLSDRLERLAQTMNRQIDTQIANARMMHVQRGSDRIDAAQLVARAVNEYPFQTPKERAVVRVHIVRNFEFTASEAQLMQVLFNLIKNAIHALHRGQTPWQEGGLLIRVLERQGRGLIQVIDKGAGIAPELLPHLFTPFVSTQKNMSHGLGLAFCKQVIEATEGRIHASSEPAMGTQFELDLPSDRPLQHNTLSDRF